MVLAQVNLGEHKPIQYILGGTEFCGLWFEVTADTFIPRPETEVLVEYIIQNYKDREIRVIDLGTGCGNIAVTLAKNLRARVYAVDISIKALKVARQNATRYKVEDRIEFFCSDWFKGLRVNPVNLIVSNPPYIAKQEWPWLPSNVKDYEPRIALWGGEKGIEHYKTILREAAKFLIPGGELVFEIGWNQGNLVRALAESTGGFTNVRVTKDYEGRDRIVALYKHD